MGFDDVQRALGDTAQANLDLLVVVVGNDERPAFDLISAIARECRHPLVVAYAPTSMLSASVQAGTDDFLAWEDSDEALGSRLTLVERRVRENREHRQADDIRNVSYANLMSLIENTDDFEGFSEFTRDITKQRRAQRVLDEAHGQLERKVEERTEALERSNRALQEEINERKRAEAALRASEERYRTVYNTAPLAFVLWDREGGIVDWNRHAEQVFGYQRDETLGRRFVDLVVPEGKREGAEKRMRELLAGEGFSHSTDTNITKSGRLILCNWSRARLFDSHGEVAGVMSLGLDVTEQRRMEERLRRSEKMEAIGQLAGGVAHDFNNQLVGVMGYADMIERCLDDERLKGYARNILQSARRSADLIAQLLAFARKGKYVSAPVDLHEVIGEVIGLLERSIDKGIVIQQELGASDATTLGDPTQIQSGLLNLALNARDAMPEGGVLTFETSVASLTDDGVSAHARDIDPGRYVRLRVRDTGVGMERAMVDRIFEPFFTTKPSGTGMGLAAVYGTVRSHRGLIQVDTVKGKGTTFEILLPQHDRGVDRPGKAPGLGQPSKRARILVVDDEPMVCELAADMIRALGHDVITSTEGQDAVLRYQQGWRDIDIVIFDMIMPKMSGSQLLDALRAIHPDVKAVLSSGYAIDDRARGILDSGVRGFLQKPYDLTKLAKIICDLTDE